MKRLCDLGEHEILRHIRAWVPPPPAGWLGIGDDAAMVPALDASTVLTTDAVIEGVHFERGEQPARIGNKAAGRGFSDLAAMAAQPAWLLVNLVAPDALRLDELEALYAGLLHRCAAHGAHLLGGDVARGDQLSLHITAGGTAEPGILVTRSGGRPGDALFVTGSLGGSRHGRHLDFAPRVAEGGFLGHWASAMIDVSDGLLGDLGQLCAERGTGAELELAAIPLAASAADLEAALGDGEDYELLFTVPDNRVEAFAPAWKAQFELSCSRIGCLNDSGQLSGRDQSGSVRLLSPQGYEHFK